MRKRSSKDWISTSEMAQLLGIADITLLRQRDRGSLIEGKHWYCPNKRARRKTYRWHKQRVEKLLTTAS